MTDIYSKKTPVEIHIQGGIAKENGEFGILKMQAMVVEPILKEEKLRKRKEEEKKQPKQSVFGKLLQNVCEELTEQTEITCKTNGYTKEAKTYLYQYSSKGYRL